MSWLDDLKKEFVLIDVKTANTQGYYSLEQIADATGASVRQVTNKIYPEIEKYETIFALNHNKKKVRCFKPKNTVQEARKGTGGGPLLGKKKANRG